MKRYIDLAAWNRREHFLHFSRFTDPYFGVTVHVDFTELHRAVRASGGSFFLWSLHRILWAVNALEPFRYRVEDGRVVCYDTIHASSTIGRADGTYGIGFIEYDPDHDAFIRRARQEIERVQGLSGLCFDDNAARTDVIHFSPVPWLAFTEMKHPAAFPDAGSVPRISTGKLIPANGRMLLPVSLSAHHGLMDGRHAGEFFSMLEKPCGCEISGLDRCSETAPVNEFIKP